MKKQTDRKRCDYCGGKFNGKDDMFKVNRFTYCENCYNNHQDELKGDFFDEQCVDCNCEKGRCNNLY